MNKIFTFAAISILVLYSGNQLRSMEITEESENYIQKTLNELKNSSVSADRKLELIEQTIYKVYASADKMNVALYLKFSFIPHEQKERIFNDLQSQALSGFNELFKTFDDNKRKEYVAIMKDLDAIFFGWQLADDQLKEATKVFNDLLEDAQNRLNQWTFTQEAREIIPYNKNMPVVMDPDFMGVFGAKQKAEAQAIIKKMQEKYAVQLVEEIVLNELLTHQALYDLLTHPITSA